MLRFVVAGTSAGKAQMAASESPFPRMVLYVQVWMLVLAVGRILGWMCLVDYLCVVFP